MLIQEEVWKDIKGYEGYYTISNMGRVKSLDRVILKRNGGQARIREKYLKPSINGKDGRYPQPVIVLSKDSKIKLLSYESLIKKHFKDYNIVITAAVTYVPSEGEILKPVRGYEGRYEVSNKGNVISLNRFESRKDGVDRRVGHKVLSHYYTTLCLSDDKGSQTVTFPHLIVALFHPEYNEHLHYPKKMRDTEDVAKNYEYFRKMEINPISVTDREGNVERFNNYKDCNEKYNISRQQLDPIRSFLKFFFLEGISTVKI
jgi:hypothetical protein